MKPVKSKNAGGGGYPKRNKYRNRRTDGFDSQKERDRFYELKLLERAGIIKDLKTQVKFQLVPPEREPDKIGPRGGVTRGKVISPGIDYIADFTYYQGPSFEEFIVEDVKGYKGGSAYRIFTMKKTLMRYLKGLNVLET